MDATIGKLKNELAEIRNQAVSAHIAGDKSKADCLTGKAVGMKSTLAIAERVLNGNDREAVGELEGMERVIEALSPLPKCNNGHSHKNGRS
jgi:hypothetical protein